MSTRFKGLVSFLIMAASSTVFTSAAVADEAVTINSVNSVIPETLSESFDRVYFTNDGNFFSDESLGSRINFILGQGSLLKNSFPENQIARDARLTNILYNDALKQQVSSTPLIRTPDLPNPYDTSLLVNPVLYLNRATVNGSVPVSGEFLFEPSPR